jgi:4-hydroxy-tetrahydrodipicolinate reductase
MKIALLGYGKMGKTIEQIALARGHEIVVKISIDNPADLTVLNLKRADVAIEFTSPDSAFKMINACFDASVPVVCGSTGWLDKFNEVTNRCQKENKSFFYSSNYSIGVNILFEINKSLARIMNSQPQYNPVIEEVHHTHKLDSPSGTALTLANGMLKEISRLNSIHEYDNRKGEKPENIVPGELPVVSFRLNEVPGTHRVIYNSDDDEIMIMHHAKSRRGFAEGAVLAAEWLRDKKGVFGMKDLLNISC